MNKQIDKNNTYILIQDSSNTFYRLPLNALRGMIALANEENEKIDFLIEAIDDLSSCIIDLSLDFIENYYPLTQLKETFELKSDVDYLKIDKSILTENDVDKYLEKTDILLRDDAETMYDSEQEDADKVFEILDDESEKYDIEEDDSLKD